MLCAYEMIEYFYSVANRIVEEKKKANIAYIKRIVFQKTYTKPWLK